MPDQDSVGWENPREVETRIETEADRYLEGLEGDYSCSVDVDNEYGSVTLSLAFTESSTRPSIAGLVRTAAELLEGDGFVVEDADSNPSEGYYLVELRQDSGTNNIQLS